MKSVYVSLFAAGLVAAQSYRDVIPECAVSCIDDALPQTECQADDIACLCEPSTIETLIGAASTCVQQSCGIEGAVDVVQSVDGLCAGAGSGATQITESISGRPSQTSDATRFSILPTDTITRDVSSTVETTTVTEGETTVTDVTSTGTSTVTTGTESTETSSTATESDSASPTDDDSSEGGDDDSAAGRPLAGAFVALAAALFAL